MSVTYLPIVPYLTTSLRMHPLEMAIIRVPLQPMLPLQSLPPTLKEKHVTIDDSPTEPSPWKELQDDTTLYRGVQIPNHMLSPGQDGYRTPILKTTPRKPVAALLPMVLARRTESQLLKPIPRQTSYTIGYRTLVISCIGAVVV